MTDELTALRARVADAKSRRKRARKRQCRECGGSGLNPFITGWPQRCGECGGSGIEQSDDDE